MDLDDLPRGCLCNIHAYSLVMHPIYLDFLSGRSLSRHSARLKPPKRNPSACSAILAGLSGLL